MFAPLSQSVRVVCAPVWGGFYGVSSPLSECVLGVCAHLSLSLFGLCVAPLYGGVPCVRTPLSAMDVSASLGESLRIACAPVYRAGCMVCVCVLCSTLLSECV